MQNDQKIFCIKHFYLSKLNEILGNLYFLYAHGGDEYIKEISQILDYLSNDANIPIFITGICLFRHECLQKINKKYQRRQFIYFSREIHRIWHLKMKNEEKEKFEKRAKKINKKIKERIKNELFELTKK
ncbi:hypothetical protein GVAV_000976 [Gurleya vavrai]